jgi:hypothetical protein
MSKTCYLSHMFRSSYSSSFLIIGIVKEIPKMKTLFHFVALVVVEVVVVVKLICLFFKKYLNERDYSRG